MRAIWSHSTRPRVACHSQRTSTISRLRREAAFVRIPPTITFGDAFAILLPSVLTCAFVLDLSWKDLRRKEWDRKLAEVQEEIEVLHAREAQSWSSHQQRSVRLGASLQRRTFSTAARTMFTENKYNEGDSLQTDAEYEPPSWGSVDQASSSLTSISLSTRSIEYQRMIAIQLALQMILQVHYGTSPKYANLDTVLELQPDTLPPDVNALVMRLKSIKRRLRDLKVSGIGAKSNGALDLSALRMIDNEIQTRVHAFQEGLIGLPDLVRDYAGLVARDGGIPSVKGYQTLLRCASQAEHRSLAYYIAWAIRTCGLPLDDQALYHLFLHYGKMKDTNMIDDLLKTFSHRAGPHDPLPPFQVWKFDGSLISVPRNADGRILRVLIYGALKNDQLERAERWAMILRQKDHEWIGNYDVFKNFLVYYGTRRDWVRGRHWLELCKRSLVDVAKRTAGELPRLLFRMLDFCVSCEKRKEYENILECAAQVGLPPHEVNSSIPVQFSPRAVDIRRNWDQALRLHQLPDSSKHTEVQMAQTLKDMLYDPSTARRGTGHYNYRLNLLTEPDPELPVTTNAQPKNTQSVSNGTNSESVEQPAIMSAGSANLASPSRGVTGSGVQQPSITRGVQEPEIDSHLWRELYQEQQKEFIKLKLGVQESGNFIKRLKNISSVWAQLETVLQKYSEELARDTNSLKRRSRTGVPPRRRRLLANHASTTKSQITASPLRMRNYRILENLAESLKSTLASPESASQVFEPFAQSAPTSAEGPHRFPDEPD